MGMNSLRSWMQRHTFRKLTIFSVGGFASYLFNIAATFILADLIGMHYLTSFIISFTVTTLFNFILAVKYIFKVRSGFAKKLALYLLSLVVLYFMNIQLVKWMVEGLGMHYTVAITVATVTIFAVKFLIYDNWVFVDEKPKTKRT